MKSFTSVVAIATLVALSTAADNLLLSTPASAEQCEVVTVSWSGGVEPYVLEYDQSLSRLIIRHASSPSSPRLFDNGKLVREAGGLTGEMSHGLIMNVVAGDSAVVIITDATGAGSASAPILILPSSNSTCL
ncbi:hypothetical protein C8Q80DRAFT_1266582 [Daedaleopsis nitida]|nr:hypothetical protein C8Q80DRAFT_1266582 [Daedaleopsis nitida]